jgi:hypothetical protein
MIRRNHSGLERLAAAGLLLAVLAGIAAVFVPKAVSDYTAAEDEIDSLNARFVELLRRDRDPAALEHRRDALRGTDRESFGMLVADTVDLARAEIQRMLQDYAAATGATIAQIRAAEADAPDLASAAVSLRIPADSLPEFLLLVTNAMPLLFIDSVDIRSGRSRTATVEPVTLTMEIELSAFVSLPNGGATR